jgi:allophanate hydrolase
MPWAAGSGAGGLAAAQEAAPWACVARPEPVLPLRPQVTALGAQLVRACRTAPVYRMFALPPGPVPVSRPSLVRQQPDDAGHAFDVEVRPRGPVPP